MTTPARTGRVAVLGAGPAGMAAALSLHQAGIEVSLIERYKEARPAGNILNLWPPPIKALGLMGVDVTDFGAPCQSEFRNSKGKTRARGPPSRKTWSTGTAAASSACCVRSSTSGCWPPSRRGRCRSTARSPPSTGTRSASASTSPTERPRSTTSWSAPTASTPWSAAPCGVMSPSASTTCTSSAGSPSTTTLDIEPGRCIVSHNRTTQGSWTAIRHRGRAGFQWWVLTAHDAAQEFHGGYHATATELARAVRPPAAAAGRSHRPQRRPAVGHPGPQTAGPVVPGPGHHHRRRRTPHLALRRLRRRHGHRGRLLPRPQARGAGPVRPRSASARPSWSSRRPAGHTPRFSPRPPTSSARCSTTRREPWPRCAMPSSTTRRSCRR